MLDIMKKLDIHGSNIGTKTSGGPTRYLDGLVIMDFQVSARYLGA